MNASPEHYDPTLFTRWVRASALNDLSLIRGALGYLLSIGMMFFGGVVLGAHR